MNRKDLQALATLRIREAQALLRAAEFSGAYQELEGENDPYLKKNWDVVRRFVDEAYAYKIA